MQTRLAHWFAPRQPTLWLLTALFFSPSPAWSLTPECGWHPRAFASASFDIPVPNALKFVGPPPPGIQGLEVKTALVRAAATWNEVQCAPELKIVESDSSTAASPVLFVDEDPCLPGGFLAFTVYACGDYPFGTILLNARDFRWSTSPSPLQTTDSDGRLIVDMLAVLTHEIGHVLGLGHLDDALATMTPRYLGDGGQATLAAIDKLTLCSTHRRSIRECTSDRECPFLQCVQQEENTVCEEERGEIGDFCGADLLICDPCLITSPATLTGYCTVACELCPSGMECGDSGLCEFSAQNSAAGCASATGNPTWLLLLTLLLTIFWRPRSRKETARRPSGNSPDDAHQRILR